MDSDGEIGLSSNDENVLFGSFETEFFVVDLRLQIFCASACLGREHAADGHKRHRGFSCVLMMLI